MYCVYRIVLPDDYFYYGSTGSTLRQRLWTHKGQSKLSSHRKLYSRLVLHLNEVRIEKVEDAGSKAEAREREQFYITQHKDNDKCLNDYDAFDTPKTKTAKRTEAQRLRRQTQTTEQKEARRIRHNELQKIRRS